MNAAPDHSPLDWDDTEVSAEAADRAEDLLREFAAEAELDMAVIVDRSGGMVAGVASRPDVDVDTVGALVAGAFGAMRSLARELGESSITESVHHGDKDTIYLREIGPRYILLGVAELALPAGIVREKAAQIAGPLSALLTEPAAALAAAASPESEIAPPPLAPPPVDRSVAQPSPATPPQGPPTPTGPSASTSSGNNRPGYVFEIG
ncbi:MAG: roadblock/LC7 domain-containing protein [Verrucomicrobiae bacterium]|nr:roadblock/LC7 domain-containing protein [Verrucomicrobiae bacterium]MCB1087256.1 roadblock/LC7 domain-containing protein [Verrucomicrobiae bacterium]MCB1091576.1 roadblock/LC7 domain-containing protein [Verrucomicrobiae bacterium]